MRRPAHQAAAIDADKAYRARMKVIGAVEAHIAEHGSEGLADFCAQYAGADYSTKSAILMMVARLCGNAARDACREVLP